MVLSGVGVLHLDVTLDRLKRRVPVAVKLGPPRIPYRETIRGRASRVEGKQKKQTGGHGQYGLCYIDVEPAERGAGLVFEDAVVGGAVPRQFIGSVEKGVRRAMARGVLGGFPTIDVKVRLLDGKAHSVDSSDAAFQTAGFRAMRAALLAAKPCVLEPVVKLDVTVPGESVGDVIGDLNSRHARVLGTADDAGRMVISALVPLAATLDYEPKLTALTHGRGHFALGFDHYDHASPAAQEKAIAESGWRLPQQDDE
jgi:elongation factor G